MERLDIEPRLRSAVLRTLLERQADEGAVRDQSHLEREAVRIAEELRRKE